MTVSPRTQAILYRFGVGLLVVELPVLAAVLQQPNPDWRLLGIGLLGGAVTALEKYLAPQLVTTADGPTTLAQATKS